MVIKSTPLEYAKSRLAFWQKRLEIAEQMPIARQAGCFTSKDSKQRELSLCRGAIQALKEVADVTYLPPADGRERKPKKSNRPEISPQAAVSKKLKRFDDNRMELAGGDAGFMGIR